MAITIQYRGKLRNVNLINTLVAEVRDICKANQWLFDAQLRPFHTTFPLLRGVSLRMDKDMSSLDLYFNKNGILFPSLVPFLTEEQHNKMVFVSSTTQFLGFEAHIKAINLLTYLDKKYFQTFELRDSGGYYPTLNREALKEEFAKSEKIILLIKEIIESHSFQQEFNQATPPSVLISRLQKRVDKIIGTAQKVIVTTDHILDVMDYVRLINKKK